MTLSSQGVLAGTRLLSSQVYNTIQSHCRALRFKANQAPNSNPIVTHKICAVLAGLLYRSDPNEAVVFGLSNARIVDAAEIGEEQSDTCETIVDPPSQALLTVDWAASSAQPFPSQKAKKLRGLGLPAALLTTMPSQQIVEDRAHHGLQRYVPCFA